MLYDQRWDAKTKADPFSLESLIAWLEMQPPETEYDWMDCEGGCLVGQYGAAIGHQDITNDTTALIKIFGGDPHGSVSRLYAVVGGFTPHTFAAALTRARAVLTERAGA